MTACTNLLVKRKEYLKQVIFDFWRMVSICNPERLSYTKKMYSLLGVCFWTWVTKNIPYLAENLILFYRRYVVWCYRKESFIFNNSSLISLRELGTVAWSNLKFKIPWITERWSYLLKIPHVSEVLASFQRHYLCNRKCLLLSGQKMHEASCTIKLKSWVTNTSQNQRGSSIFTRTENLSDSEEKKIFMHYSVFSGSYLYRIWLWTVISVEHSFKY